MKFADARNARVVYQCFQIEADANVDTRARTNLELFGAIDDLWRDLAAFDARLEFRIKLIAYDGDDGWVEGTLAAIYDTLRAPEPPAANGECEYCRYAARWAGA